MPIEATEVTTTTVIPETIVIKNWWLAQTLLEKGFTIKELKQNRYNHSKCVFVFDYSDELVAVKDEAVREKMQEREHTFQEHPVREYRNDFYPRRNRRYTNRSRHASTDELINQLVTALKASV